MSKDDDRHNSDAEEFKRESMNIWTEDQTDEEVQTEHWQTDRGEPLTGRYEGHGVGQ